MDIYTIKETTCGCHPETCCCLPYTIMRNDEEYIKIHNYKKGKEIVEAMMKSQPTLDIQDAMEEIAETADSLDTIIAATEIPLSPEIHITNIRRILDTQRKRLRNLYIKLGGDNHWEGYL